MKLTSKDSAYALVAAGSAILAARVMRSALTKSWKAIRKTDPPENPAALDTDWKEALLWSAATGVAVGIARMLAKRGAAAGWNKFVGLRPPGDYNNATIG